ncbi:tetratricopeptide repeat protein [Solitalea canadensis]|uniref:Uncharacterized protein n=1 Tax=Solitalea canadensis (strain ATCC 29591 / DSM 3403 / JCM 21819 / LMG 8368 / NBRC 15130 / NCIMB 12057 / USAM 9D) TaxID=929556 RepID=H8KT66_SOLCM|nr:tetratricopeptide repeat protein [Solitalea canadensis]AFD05249.1 hypothetical protein Solca_0093 [Solitalea canadensis DSM 3403]
MKSFFTVAFVLISVLALGQTTIQIEINYVRSFRKEKDSMIVELGNTPKLCRLPIKNNPNFVKYAALLKPYEQKDYFITRKLFEIGVEKGSNMIKSIRPLIKSEVEEYQYLQPEPALAVAAVSANQEPEKLYDEAMELFNKGSYEEATATINKAIIIHTQNPDYHELKALCLGNLKQYNQSTDEAMYALEMDKANAGLYEIIANNYYFLQDYENACKNYEKAIEYESENIPRIYHNYIRCLIEIPDPYRAIAIYKIYEYRTKGLTAYIGDEENFDDDLIFYTGQAYQQLKNWKKALAIYNRFIVMYPDFYGYYAQRGRLYQQKGDWLEALRDFDAALKLDSSQTILQLNIAQVYQELKDYRRTADAYEKYLSKYPDDAVQLGNYGYCLLDAERYKDAQKLFDQSMILDTKSIDTHIGRILAAHLLGDTEKKNEYIGEAKRQFPEIAINTATLNTLIKTGNYYYSDKIITIWEDAIN